MSDKAEILSEVKQHLQDMHDGELGSKWFDQDSGVCSNLDVVLGKYYLSDDIFAEWPECHTVNGKFDTSYPVGGLGEFYRRNKNGDYISLWADDEWGDKRRRLCLWLIENLKEEHLI